MLHGTIPNIFSTSLKNLRRLYISQNFLSGTLPQSLLEHTYISELYLTKNKLEGSFPNISSMIALKEFSIGKTIESQLYPIDSGE